MKLLLVIGAVLAVTVSRTDGTVTVPTRSRVAQQGRSMKFSCQVTGENFQYWETPAKPAREGQAAIPSVRIPLSQTTGTRKISANDVVGNTRTVELTIDPVTLNDGGDYICQGDSNSSVFTLQVDFENGQVKQAQELHLGKKETIELGVSAYPLLTYEWEKDGIPLTFSGKTLDPYTGSITIDSVQESDEGTYKCKIIFTGPPTSEATNNIVVTTISEPKIRKYQGDPVTRRLTQGNNVTFHCDVESGHPKPVVTWWYGWVDQSKKVDKIYDARFSHPTDETWTITGIEPNDKRDFRCIAENKAGTADLKFQIIAVDVSPKIDPMEDEIIKNEQEQVDIECVVSGDPTPIVEWFHHGSYYPGQTTLMRGDKKVAKISFPNIHIYNTGDYTCQAKNGAMDSAGQVIVVKETVKLYVRSPPKIDKIASPTPVYSFVGITRAVTVTCTFSGYPVLTVRMYSENGTEIARGNTTASYTLKTTTEEDFGKFNCTAENPDGKAEHLMELKKAVRPGPPRNVAANKTCKEIILKWQHPLENGGMKILNYIITVLLDGSQLNTENADGASVQHKIRYSVKPETKYEIQIRARNEPGTGNEEIIFVTTDKFYLPGKPLITNLDKNVPVDTEFTITWLAPKYDGGDSAITYKLELRMTPITKDTEVRIEENITETQFMIKGLENGKTYQVTLVAVNEAGSSEPAVGMLKTKSKTGKPSEVRNFRAVPTCNSITLTWRTPTDDGGMPINKYVLVYKGMTRNIDGDDTSYTILDLKQNTKYTITMRATNKAEWGRKSSVEVQTTTYCAPGRPVIYSPSSNLLNAGTLTLMWRAPEETGGDDDITYTVRYRVEKDKNTGNHGAWKTIITKNLQVEISELDNKVSYKFEVTAKNKGGTSEPAEKYIQTNFPGKRSSQARLVSSTFLTISVGGIFLLL